MTAAALRQKLSVVLAASAVGGAVTAALVSPSAGAEKDPCAASEVARTVSSVAKSTGDYLDGHPETNQIATNALQQQPGPQTVATLGGYFGAHPEAKTDLEKISAPLTELSDKCKFAVGLPQLLGMMQAAQAGGGLPGGIPVSLPGNLPGGIPGGVVGAVPPELVTGALGAAAQLP